MTIIVEVLERTTTLKSCSLLQKPGITYSVKEVSADERWDWEASFHHNRACIHLVNEQPWHQTLKQTEKHQSCLCENVLLCHIPHYLDQFKLFILCHQVHHKHPASEHNRSSSDWWHFYPGREALTVAKKKKKAGNCCWDRERKAWVGVCQGLTMRVPLCMDIQVRLCACERVHVCIFRLHV